MTKTLTYEHPSYLPQLDGELIAAIPALAPVPIPGDPNGLKSSVFALSGDDTTVWVTVADEIADQDVAAVIAAHVPRPPITYTETHAINATTVTTDDQPLEVLRFPCDEKRRYTANLRISGIDRGNFVSRDQEGRFVWKRTTAPTAVMVGITIVSNLGEAASASWAPNAVASGADVVFTVKGAAGRTIDWLLVGAVEVYAPGGVES